MQCQKAKNKLTEVDFFFKYFILQYEKLMQRLPSVSSWKLLDKNDSGDGNGFSICADDFKSVMRMFSATVHSLTLSEGLLLLFLSCTVRVQSNDLACLTTPCYLW